MTAADEPAVTFDDLLRHEAWLRALAHRLVGEQDADDVVQDTFAAALARRGPVGNPAAWLGRVVQNLARLRRRRALRRTRRERATARREALPSTEAVVQELAALRRVSRAVSELDEPYRTTIVQRFYHELSTGEMARRAGTSEAAVRQRLSRGLGRLRARLAGELGPDWRGCAALAPLMQVVPVNGPATAVAAISSVLAMKRTLLAAAAVVFVGVTAGTWSALGGSASDPGDAAPDGQVAAAVADAPEPGAGELSARRREVEPAQVGGAPAQVAPVFRLRGRVLSPLGEPLEGVDVGVLLRRGRPVQQPNLPIDPARASDRRVLATSDVRGEFEIECARFRGALYAIGRHATLRTTPFDRSAARHDGLLVVAAPAVELRGAVRTEDGAPLPDASLWLVPQELDRFPGILDRTRPVHYGGTRSGGFGEFHANGLPALSGVLEFVHRGPDGERRASIAVPAEDQDGVVVVMRSAIEHRWVVAGRVLDAAGQPVRARVGMSEDTAYTDENGEFRFELSASDPSAAAHSDRIWAGKFGYEGTFVDGMRARMREAPDGFVHLDLVLGPPAKSISGRVLTADGTPVAEAMVVPWDLEPLNAEGYGSGRTSAVEDLATQREGEVFAWGPLWTCVYAKTGADGGFELHGLSDRAYELRAFVRGRWIATTSGPHPAGSRNVEIRLPAETRRAPFSGRIVARDGRALAGVEVRPAVPGLRIGERVERVELDGARTDADGRFRLEDVPRSADRLHVDGDLVLPVAVTLPRDPIGVLPIIADLRCHFRVDLGATPGAASFSILDARGRPLEIHAFEADRHEVATSLPLRDGRSTVLCVSDAAATLVVHDADGAERSRHRIRLDPGPVRTVPG